MSVAAPPQYRESAGAIIAADIRDGADGTPEVMTMLAVTAVEHLHRRRRRLDSSTVLWRALARTKCSAWGYRVGGCIG
jgi:hypothetical protein